VALSGGGGRTCSFEWKYEIGMSESQGLATCARAIKGPRSLLILADRSIKCGETTFFLSHARRASFSRSCAQLSARLFSCFLYLTQESREKCFFAYVSTMNEISAQPLYSLRTK